MQKVIIGLLTFLVLSGICYHGNSLSACAEISQDFQQEATLSSAYLDYSAAVNEKTFSTQRISAGLFTIARGQYYTSLAISPLNKLQNQYGILQAGKIYLRWKALLL